MTTIPTGGHQEIEKMDGECLHLGWLGSSASWKVTTEEYSRDARRYPTDTRTDTPSLPLRRPHSGDEEPD